MGYLILLELLCIIGKMKMIFYGMSHITETVVRNWKNTRIKMNSVIRFVVLCFHVI